MTKNIELLEALLAKRKTMTRSQKINHCRENYLEYYSHLVKAFPNAWWDSRFLYFVELLIEDTYNTWKKQQLTDEEFEYTFGGEPDAELIWYVFRPTAELTEDKRKEDYDPPITKNG